MEVLGGYEVEVFPGNKYADAHLFVRGTYVHKIVVTETAIILSDAGVFDGPRIVFTSEESVALRALTCELQATTQIRRTQKRAVQSTQALGILKTTAGKLTGMDRVQIFD